MDYQERIDGKVGMLFQIAEHYLSGQVSLEQAKESIGFEMVHIRQSQVEAMKTQLGQRLKEMDSVNAKTLFELFQQYLSPPFHKLQDGHPLKNYFEENGRMRDFLLQLDQMEGAMVAQEDWEEFYTLLRGFRLHIERQTKNFYPLLSSKGLRLQIEKANALGEAILDGLERNHIRLRKGDLIDFLYQQRSLSQNLMDYMDLEERVLYGKALASLTFQEFVHLRKSDDVMGYAYIDMPAKFPLEENRSTVMETAKENEYPQKQELSQDPILSSLLWAKDMNATFYAPSGRIISRMGELAEPWDQVLEEKILQSFISGDEKKKRFFFEEKNQIFLITYSLVRNEKGALQGYLKTKENLRGIREFLEEKSDIPQKGKEMNQAPGNRTVHQRVDSSQNMGELFKIYPKFQEDFYELDEDLKGLKGPFGMEILNESSIEMLAKSLRMDTEMLVDQINQLLKGY